MVVGKAHGHHISKALHLVAYLQNTAFTVTPVSFYSLSVQFSVLVSHVIENQEIGGSKSGTESNSEGKFTKPYP